MRKLIKPELSITLMNRFYLGLLLCMPLLAKSQNKEIGKAIPAWKPGEIEIHHIYTGRGESSFLILPDGTSMLIDAGDFDPDPEEYALMTPLLPDSSKRAGTLVADYIKKVNPKREKVDYLLISHFHNDHIGGAKKGQGMSKNRNPNYQLSGVAQVAETIQFNRVVDRAFPNYYFPMDLTQDADILNYMNFIRWQLSQKSFQVEAFLLGSTTQFNLNKSSKNYPNFSIRNLFSNGMVWNPRNQRVDTLYYQANQTNQSSWNENTMSCGIRLDYGPFSYYTGGDLSGAFLDADKKTVDIEAYAAMMCGPVEVSKANHHAYLDAMSAGFVRAIQSKFFIIPVWDQEHIQPEVMSRMLTNSPSDKDTKLLFTHFPESKKQMPAIKPFLKDVLADGHIIVKVADQGRSYTIYALDATRPDHRIKAVYGPFQPGASSRQETR